ncbi:MAG TPA: hypothetical protein PKD35_01100, partial [Nitrosomonas sp.]|nr:hypothetical protein [Nitrosomonas sp.]
KNNLLTIPNAIIDENQIVFDAEMQLQPNGLFILKKYNEQPETQISIDEPFFLEMDQTAWIRNTNLRLKLTAITEDSRCPIGAECFTAGTVRIVLALYQGVEHIQDYQLSMGLINNDFQDIGNLRIKLLNVTPSPPSLFLKSADYSATILIKLLD